MQVVIVGPETRRNFHFTPGGESIYQGGSVTIPDTPPSDTEKEKRKGYLNSLKWRLQDESPESQEAAKKAYLSVAAFSIRAMRPASSAPAKEAKEAPGAGTKSGKKDRSVE